MNVLLVDDELDVLEGIMDGVDFSAIGISRVYLSQSAAHAKEMLDTLDIDIMVTDIEMPGENGLDLLRWVRDSGLDIVTLFCTGYADFNYAQKAVEMHSFDYFLKPIAYGALQERLASAVKEAEKNQSLKSHSKYWQNLQQENKKHFWTQLLTGELREPQAIRKSMESQGLSYTLEDPFLLYIPHLSDGEETLSAWKRYAFENLRDELFSPLDFTFEASPSLEGGMRVTIWRLGPNFSIEEFRGRYGELCVYAAKHLNMWANFYYEKDCLLSNIRQAFLRLEDIVSDDVTSRGKLYSTAEYQKKSFPYSLPQLPEWELLLAACQADRLVAEINAHLDRLVNRGELNRPYSKAIRIDMMQMIHTVLNQRQVNARSMFYDQRFDSLRENSLRSVEDLKRYLEYIVRTASDYLGFSSESQSVVGKVREYIDSHYSEDITRTSMAKIVFLNSDYLARLFKKETGQSLGAYLQDRRIHEAKKLLVQTPTQVNEIALQVGYDNFSYFSHIFREKTGMTPNEYRKEHK